MNTIHALLFMSLTLFGCADSNSVIQTQGVKTISGKDSVKILSVSPASTDTLKVGSDVKIRYEVKYNLVSADTGSLTLVVQDPSSGVLGNQRYVVHKGSGTEILEMDIVVPPSRVVIVFTSFSPQDATTTTIVDANYFKIEQ